MLESGFVRVLESFGKLWKLIMSFSRTMERFGEGMLFKMAMEQFWVFVREKCNGGVALNVPNRIFRTFNAIVLVIGHATQLDI